MISSDDVSVLQCTCTHDDRSKKILKPMLLPYHSMPANDSYSFGLHAKTVLTMKHASSSMLSESCAVKWACSLHSRPRTGSQIEFFSFLPHKLQAILKVIMYMLLICFVYWFGERKVVEPIKCRLATRESMGSRK